MGDLNWPTDAEHCWPGGLDGAEHSAAALSILLEGLRLDLRSRGIDVTILSPGFVRSEEHKKRRPFEVPHDAAVSRMVKAIERRHRSCSFPLWLALLLTFLRCLPPTLADAIVAAIRSRA